MIESLLAIGGTIATAVATKKWIVPSIKVCAKAIRGAIRELVPSDPKAGNGSFRDYVLRLGASVNQVLLKQVEMVEQSNKTLALIHDTRELVGTLDQKHNALHERLDITVGRFEAHIKGETPEFDREPARLTPRVAITESVEVVIEDKDKEDLPPE